MELPRGDGGVPIGGGRWVKEKGGRGVGLGRGSAVEGRGREG